MYLYGASGHAKVILEILECVGIPISGLYDVDPDITSVLGYPVTCFPDVKEGEAIIIAIGNNKQRKEIALQIKASFGNAIHPSVNISKRAEIAEGTVVMAGVTINSTVSIGKHCIINTNASVDHDCLLEDFVHVSPNATLCGGVRIGEGTHIGASAVVIPEIKIGQWVTVGAGSVVIKDIPDYATVVGNPARIIKLS